MTSYLIDINVWLAFSWNRHAHHSTAHVWLRQRKLDNSRLLFCRVTQLGLLRLLANKAILGDEALTMSEAFAVFDQWMADPRCEFSAEAADLDLPLRTIAGAFPQKGATKALMDSYLIAFAFIERSTLVTMDQGLAVTAERYEVPVIRLAA
jgi:hypothetical protein